MGFDNGSIFYLPLDNTPTDIVMLAQIQVTLDYAHTTSDLNINATLLSVDSLKQS
jgi:hypothetical protein